jgi:hypothetical protein
MKVLARYIALVTVIFVMSAFQTPGSGNYQLLASLHGDDFKSYSTNMYESIDFRGHSPNFQAFQFALRGYMYLNKLGEIKNRRYLTIVDYSLSSNEPRLWLVDVIDRKLIVNELVAHGKYSGNEYAKSFSNTYRSKKSCLGFLITGDIYNGRHRLSLKLHGIERGFNHNAFGRGIVFHGANYVNQEYIVNEQRIGRSFGCPAVSQEINATLVELIQGGSCVFFYYPDERYLRDSKIINNDLYIPIEEFKTN